MFLLHVPELIPAKRFGWAKLGLAKGSHNQAPFSISCGLKLAWLFKCCKGFGVVAMVKKADKAMKRPASQSAIHTHACVAPAGRVLFASGLLQSSLHLQQNVLLRCRSMFFYSVLLQARRPKLTAACFASLNMCVVPFYAALWLGLLNRLNYDRVLPPCQM